MSISQTDGQTNISKVWFETSKKKFKKSWNKAELLLENKNIMAVDRVMLKINELKVGVTLNRNKRYMWGSIYK